MTNKGGRERAQSYVNTENGFANNNNYNEDDNNSNNSNGVRNSNRVQSQYNNIPRPARPTSGLSQNNIEAEQQQYQNTNFRKAFVPRMGNDNMQRNDSSENLAQINDILLNGGGIALPK